MAKSEITIEIKADRVTIELIKARRCAKLWKLAAKKERARRRELEHGRNS